MPTLADLQSRFAQPGTLPETNHDISEEALVCDSRASMTPTQVVDQKLRYAMRSKGAFATTPESIRRLRPR